MTISRAAVCGLLTLASTRAAPDTGDVWVSAQSERKYFLFQQEYN